MQPTGRKNVLILCNTLGMCNKLVQKYGISTVIIGPQREKTCLRWFSNNKGTDQPAHPRSLISAFVIHLLESIITRLASSEILYY